MNSRNTIDTAMIPAKIMFRPENPKYADENRLWQGIPSLERTRHGNIYVVFYTGMKTEESGNYVMVVRSKDNGKTWLSVEMIIEHGDPEMRVFDPCLWHDPLGRLWLTWTQSRGFFDGRGGVWAIVSENPDDEMPTWSSPERIANGLMMNKPTVLSTGEWLFPCAIWACKEPLESHQLDSERFSNVYATIDNGKTFNLLGGADVPDRSFDEHMIIEKKDGTLWILVRTFYGIGQSFSSDGGYTWSKGEDSGLGGPCSRFFIRRLRSGNLLLVNHYNFTGRNNLTAMLSKDDGKTWEGFLVLDERDDVSYPDGVQADDGTIYIVYDHDRYGDKEILMASFTEEDVLAGQCVTSNAQLKILVNKAGKW
jgi:hypothetical protein